MGINARYQCWNQTHKAKWNHFKLQPSLQVAASSLILLHLSLKGSYSLSVSEPFLLSLTPSAARPDATISVPPNTVLFSVVKTQENDSSGK